SIQGGDRCILALSRLRVFNGLEWRSVIRDLDSLNYSASARWTNETAIDPSPTADATRLTLPHRTSPTANTPGSEVSSRYGERLAGHRAAARSSFVRSRPVLMKPFASSATRPFSQPVFASAPVIRNTCLRS